MSHTSSVSPADAWDAVLAQLRDLDARVDATSGSGLSLDPSAPGRRATRAATLAARLADAPHDERLVLGMALAEVGEAVLDAFPNNLFWDLDGVLAELRRAAKSSLDAVRALARALAPVLVRRRPGGPAKQALTCGDGWGIALPSQPVSRNSQESVALCRVAR